jgi:integrase
LFVICFIRSFKLKLNHADYSLYKKKINGSVFWYARFWNPRKKKYAAFRSLGIELTGTKGRQKAAEQTAAALFPSILAEWGLSAGSSVAFLDYIRSFWSADCGYFKDFEVSNGAPVTTGYIAAAQRIIRLHISLFEQFDSISLKELDHLHIRDFQQWGMERGMSRALLKQALRVMRIPVSYAIKHNELSIDPFLKVPTVSYKPKPKGILLPEERDALVNAACDDKQQRLAVFIGLFAGLRISEARGLKWDDVDLGNDYIYLRKQWKEKEGLRRPKYNSVRDIPIAAPLRDALLDVSGGKGFVFPALISRKGNCPASLTSFETALYKMLGSIGISKDDMRKRNISFHSLRHCFVSYARSQGLNDFEIMRLAGHKSMGCMNTYSHTEAVNMEWCKKLLTKRQNLL